MNGAIKFSGRFIKQIVGALVVVVGLAWYPLVKYAGKEIIEAVMGGIVLSLINVLMGYAAIEISFDKSYTKFLQIVMGGIVIRLFVMIGLLVVLILVFQFHVMPLVVSLFVMYIIFLVFEVLHIHNKWQTKIQTQNS